MANRLSSFGLCLRLMPGSVRVPTTRLRLRPVTCSILYVFSVISASGCPLDGNCKVGISLIEGAACGAGWGMGDIGGFLIVGTSAGATGGLACKCNPEALGESRYRQLGQYSTPTCTDWWQFGQGRFAGDCERGVETLFTSRAACGCCSACCCRCTSISAIRWACASSALKRFSSSPRFARAAPKRKLTSTNMMMSASINSPATLSHTSESREIWLKSKLLDQADPLATGALG